MKLKMIKPRSNRLVAVIPLMLLLLWAVLHAPGIFYGTGNLPFHENYVSTDEQPSVNSAMRMVNEKNIFAFRNQERQYYGPLMVIVSTPGVLADYALKYLTNTVRSAEEYKNAVIWDWSGILRNIRLSALLSMAIGLVFLYALFSTTSVNPSKSRWIPLVATVLLGFNYYYFQYAHFAFHWAYIVPLLIIQLYTFVRIVETDGQDKRVWWWHGIATVVSFGISYIGAIFLVFWAPWLLEKLKLKSIAALKKFLWLAGGIAVGWAMIIAWHPFAFVRYASFWGIGTPVHNNGDTLNPFAFAGNSFSYYTELLVVNHLALCVAIIILLYVLRKSRPWSSLVFWAFALPGAFSYVLFSLMTHVEGRYALPAVLSLTLVGSLLLAQYIATNNTASRTVSVMIGTLIGANILFHVVHIALLMSYFSAGPIRQHAVDTALELQKTGSPVLIINTTILGHPHTIDAYKAYAQYKGFGDIPLYRAIYAAGLPANTEPLNARYINIEDYEANNAVVNQYAHAVFSIKVRQGEWNQFNYFDENMLRAWYRGELSDRFIILK